MYIRGIRGATTVDNNSENAIISETKRLLEELLSKNEIVADDIASIFFSTTSDLDQAFPAKAARLMGLNETPLLCLNEIPVQNSLSKCVRILLHVNTEKAQRDMHHIYLKGAQNLRSDQRLG